MVAKIQPILAAVIGILGSMQSISCENTQIHKLVYNNNGLGVYSFEYATSDGTYRREEGGHSPDSENLSVRGEFRYLDPNGNVYSLRYIADENGYRPLPEEDTRFNDRNLI